MSISFENVNRDIPADDKTLLTESQRFICMFFEDIFHIRRTAANLAALGIEAGFADDIVEKIEQIIDISEEISHRISEKMTGVIPRSNIDLNDWS